MDWSQASQEQRNAFIWFTESQLRFVIRNGIVPEWFHGIISRKMSEELLMSKPPGYFLIRVSESRIGYTLSYRAEDRCRHFMIDALADGHYVIAGENTRHRFLQELVDFHRRTPIMPFSEVLTVACGQASNDKTDYAELLFAPRHPNPDTSWLPSNALHPSISQPTSQEDTPPALPYRPNHLRSSAVLPTEKLYPDLEEEIAHVSSPRSAMPVPRKRYTADPQPPDVPARSSVPQLKQNQVCVRTVSAPERPTTPTAAAEHPLSSHTPSAKDQEARLSVVSNLKNLKKKFQKKRNTMQEYMYAEVDVEAAERGGNVGNEYQEIGAFDAQPFSYTCTDGGLPHEYLPPPPFAPGY